MFDKILAYGIVAVGAGLLARATLGRLFGFHRPGQWQGGGQISLTGELAIGTFVLCIGLAAAHHPAWVLLILPAWVVAYISQWRSGRRHAAEEEALRTHNAAAHPGVFDRPPPDDLDCVPADELDVYDAGACTYLGRAARPDVRALVERFAIIPEQGPNDIFLIVESLLALEEESVSPEFVTLLRRALENRDYLVLRWLPPGHANQVLPTGS